MSGFDPDLTPRGERDEDLLTRAEASTYLARFNIVLKPATLARIWCVGGNGPPCQHIRRRPFYPRAALRAWAMGQRTALRRSPREAPRPDVGPARR